MVTSIFVTLPTSDLERAKKFYSGLGWKINPLFTDENAASIVIDENLFLMILTREYLGTFTDKPIVDPGTALQTQTAFSRESREEVDAILEKAVAAGGTAHEAQDYGFMYARDFEDPDGNLFSALWMDPVAAEIGPEAFMAKQEPGA
ncbi:putative lactoylglutathione lyase [Cryobacterium sp. MP_M5]|uniref:VOC family protein n=1 Tax=unclassified Cryobacterium TaxID=2649013 RepID=UPI0018CB4DC6|nr:MULTISPECIES: VOC family protein [unclassified Cryobacterium]MBG6057415.1 putative lactoylglutathione lyase [Cryobacterium sp. MP_M3]MEC5175614.1 putative lactoylglutathione lyase [Cryobacterium sp. MP_M5]